MLIFDIFNYFPDHFPILQTVISAIVAFVLGIIWYNPHMMGQAMTEVRNEETKDYKPGFIVYVVAFLSWFITASVYSFLMGFLTPPSVLALLGLSTFLWVGFVLPASLLSGLMAGKKLMVIAGDSSYFLAGLYLFAVIHDVL